MQLLRFKRLSKWREVIEAIAMFCLPCSYFAYELHLKCWGSWQISLRGHSWQSVIDHSNWEKDPKTEESKTSLLLSEGEEVPVNYRLARLTLYLGKVTELLTLETISRHVSEKRISSRQCEFTKSHDWLIQWTAMMKWLAWWARGERWTLSVWTSLRPLTLVSCKSLPNKQLTKELDAQWENCLKVWAQRVVMCGTGLVTGQWLAVPLGTLLGPISFNTLVNYLANGAEYTLSKAADHTELRGVADSPEGHVAIQRDHSGMKKSADRKLKVQQEVRIPAPIYAGVYSTGKHLDIYWYLMTNFLSI